MASGEWQVASGGDVWATLTILDALLLTVVGHHIGHERPCATQLEDWNLGASLAGPPNVKQKTKKGRQGGKAESVDCSVLTRSASATTTLWFGRGVLVATLMSWDSLSDLSALS